MLKDRKLAKDLTELAQSMIEPAQALQKAVIEGDFFRLEELKQSLIKTSWVLRCQTKKLEDEFPFWKPEATITSFQWFVIKLSYDTVRLVEIESIIQQAQWFAAYLDYFCNIYPDKKQMEQFWEETAPRLLHDRVAEKHEKKGSYPVEVTIFVLAYNHLDITKKCLTSILTHLPPDISYELIVHNHGSNDGTREYFKKFHPDCLIDSPINGAMLATVYPHGKYILSVSNDVFVLHHSIANMVKLLRQDAKAGMVVPMTTNISNYQEIPDAFASQRELEEFSVSNNQYDINRHIQRSRLCTPLAAYQETVWFGRHGLMFYNVFFAGQERIAFPDDMMSLQVRRKGLKNILQKDAFCYHAGSITIKKQITSNREQVYLKGRELIRSFTGIDPWGTGNCYAPYLIQALPLIFEGHIDILGINSGLGDNPLQLKERYKEKQQNRDVTLTILTDDAAYLSDLSGIADSLTVIHEAGEMINAVKGRKFHYIILENPFQKRKKLSEILRIMGNLLYNGGFFAMGVPEGMQEIQKLQMAYPQFQFVGQRWMIARKEQLSGN